MKKSLAVAILGMSLAASLPAHARNIRYMLPISAAMAGSNAARVDNSIKVVFGPQTQPQSGQPLGPASGSGKGYINQREDSVACNEAFLVALQALQTRAKNAGANMIVNVVSSYKNGRPFSSATEFECHAGTTTTGLSLSGDLLKTD